MGSSEVLVSFLFPVLWVFHFCFLKGVGDRAWGRAGCERCHFYRDRARDKPKLRSGTTFSQIVRGPEGGQGGARLRSPEAHGSAPRVSRWGWGRPSPRGQQALPLPVVTCSPHLLPVGDSLPADSLPEPPSTSVPRLPRASSREDLAGSLGVGTKRRSLWRLFADVGGKAGFGPGQRLRDPRLPFPRPQCLGLRKPRPRCARAGLDSPV